MTLNEIAEQLRTREANESVVHCLRMNRCASTPNEAAAAMGFFNTNSWKNPIELALDEASEILQNVIEFDLAYDTVAMDSERAASLANEFLSHFPGGRYFTNRDWRNRESGSWHPLTRATFDGGIVAMTSNSIGALWLGDED